MRPVLQAVSTLAAAVAIVAIYIDKNLGIGDALLCSAGTLGVLSLAALVLVGRLLSGMPLEPISNRAALAAKVRCAMAPFAWSVLTYSKIGVVYAVALAVASGALGYVLGSWMFDWRVEESRD